MKGIILIGGRGTRLRPITHVVNKNLLPVYDKPAVLYSIELFKEGGITDIAVVGEYTYLEDFQTILGNGVDYGVNITYVNDSLKRKGPASAVYCAKDFINGENVALLFSDNIFDISIKNNVENFKEGAEVFLKEVTNPKRYGVAEVNGDNVIGLEEKPDNPRSNYAITGLYLFDESLIPYVQNINPGKGGEYYITDVLETYLNDDRLKANFVDGFWSDMGTFDGLYRCNQYWYNKNNSS